MNNMLAWESSWRRRLTAAILVFWLSHNLEAAADFAQETEESTLAYVNITYVDPLNGYLHTEKSEIGKFGNGVVVGASGFVVHVSNRNGTYHNGCDLPFDNDVSGLKGESWIALIRRGQCSYTRKVSNAMNSNATAVVVYDDKRGPTAKMHTGNRVSHMVAIFIPKDKGEEIASLVDNGTRVKMFITVGTQQAVRYTNINRTSVLFVSISFIVLMIISLAWLIFYYVQRFRYIHAKDQLARRLCSAAKKALSKIPVRTIKLGDKEAEGDVECCAVCIEPYKIADVVRTLPCKHQFHKSCVDPWLLEQRTCPMCKMDILKFYGLVFTGSQESVVQMEVEDNLYNLNLSNDQDSDALASPGSSPLHSSNQEQNLAAPTSSQPRERSPPPPYHLFAEPPATLTPDQVQLIQDRTIASPTNDQGQTDATPQPVSRYSGQTDDVKSDIEVGRLNAPNSDCPNCSRRLNSGVNEIGDTELMALNRSETAAPVDRDT